MTTFAILYNRQDLTAIAAEATNPGLSSQDRQEATRYWNGGIKNWSTAPVADVQYRCVDTPQGQMCDDDMRAVVVSGPQVSKAGLVTLLRRISTTYPGAVYMGAIADDVESTAIEPWP